ncbi:J domain-containing protein [Cryobacterium sp. MDB2-10]|uniref:J domain-containing protein n=1 Tax=Cryobacterium sp. MDB2-10 TaxID=1259177 RepID=UPI0014312E94|nr:J domain-containing protein [Cryobacterium sp. MDB2-10]
MTPEAAAAILNLKNSATKAEIDAAYRLRARMSHPDRFAGAPASDIKAATAEFVRITHARDVLHARIPAPQPAAPPRAEPPPPRPQRPREPTLSFEDFVRASDASRWHGGPPPGGRSSAATSGSSPETTTAPAATPRRAVGIRAWLPITLVIAAIVVFIAGMATSQHSATSGTAASGTSISVHQDEVLDQASIQKYCEVGFNCWVWSLTSESTCPSASVSINFSSTLGGPSTGRRTKQVGLVANQPVRVVEESTAPANVYANIEAITC